MTNKRVVQTFLATSALFLAMSGMNARAQEASAPAAAASLTWTGNFFHLCRFDKDDLDALGILVDFNALKALEALLPDHTYLNEELPGALYLALISLLPLIALVLVGANQNFPFGGTSILIMVGVALDTVKQIAGRVALRTRCAAPAST